MGIPLRLAAPAPAKVLNVTGLDHSLMICVTLAEALAFPFHRSVCAG
ncbi:hypothetical protein SAMN04489712_11297 [Thermomonospora echinospora]|uniref:Uncharacterized protein n=1 Tax=Thermomonospora echinospora TaxID=1992 RepID=A0A1H6CZY5_9ACTN|nr:hypothetical protein [Thermomonospora echinospora]SEG78592.1 hypothetical protein SAMN04489712_11297 [Thermomonospora echinospora]